MHYHADQAPDPVVAASRFLTGGLSIVLAAALALTGFARPVFSAPLTEETRQIIEKKLLNAEIMSNARRALEICREANQEASQYDRDPF